MKKIWYSQPLYDIWTQYHIQSRMTPGINIEQFCQFECKEIYENDPQELWDMKTTILNMLLADHEQNLTHIFLEDPELETFLQETRLADLNGIKRFLLNNGFEQTIEYRHREEKDLCITYFFGVHVPYRKKGNGHAFMVSVNKTQNRIDFFFVHGHQFNCLTDTIYEKHAKMVDNEIIQEDVREFRFALNLIAYMNCYPDCVRDGTPHITVDNGEKRIQKAFSIRTSAEIKEVSRNKSVIPHFRKGYWKYCNSDFYKEARGKFIFVSDTMVKGNAKTVSTTNDEIRLI